MNDQRTWITIVSGIVALIVIAFVLARPTVNQESAKSGIEDIVKEIEGKQESNEEQRVDNAASANALSNDYLQLIEPTPGTLVNSPFMVRGKALARYGSWVRARIVNQDGSASINEKTRIIGGNAESYGDFSINLRYSFKHGEEKTLELFAENEKGEAQSKLSIPLRFRLVQ